jgi:hypothetical protein
MCFWDLTCDFWAKNAEIILGLEGGMPRGLKPPDFLFRERTKAEALVYLEAGTVGVGGLARFGSALSGCIPF